MAVSTVSKINYMFHRCKGNFRPGLDFVYRQVLSIRRRCPMNPLDRLLGDDLSRCLDRIAGSYGEGTLGFINAEHVGLRDRIDEADARVASLGSELLERYAAWQGALMDLEDLWALAELKRVEPQAA
jgi:hypothetical protein